MESLGLSPETLRTILLFIPALMFSLSFHEYAHGWVADRLGDATARYSGRLTLNPLAHISVMGTLVFPTLSVLFGAPLFGWANPVPVDSRNFKKPLQHMAWVAAAGPASNILFAILLTALLSMLAHSTGMGVKLLQVQGGMMGAGIELIQLTLQLNLFLAFFNLIPLPPLDGGRILQGFLSPQNALALDRIAPMGGWILLILVLVGALRFLAWPVIVFQALLYSVFQVPIF